MAAPQQRFYSIIFCLMLLSTTSSSVPSASQTFPASSRRSVQLTYATAATLPEAESLYTYGFLETEALKKEFSKPRHHKTITTNKNPGIQKILGILAKKQPATVLLTFKHSASVSSQLHLAFAFAPKPSLTITSKNPLENWQKELINTLIKKDSFWVRHPLGIASGVSIMSLMGIAVAGEIMTDFVMDLFRKTTNLTFSSVFLGRKNEFFFEEVPPKMLQPLRALTRLFGLGHHTVETDFLEIPSAATILLLEIPCRGAITKLIKNKQLITNNNEQIKALIIPISKAPLVKAELGFYRNFLKENNWNIIWINDTESTNPMGKQLLPLLNPKENIFTVAQNLVIDCTELINKRFTNQLTKESTITPYMSDVETHIRHIAKNFTATNYLIRYPRNYGEWDALGNLETSMLEVVIVPASMLSEPLPERLEFIKRSIICIINDTSVPYTMSDDLPKTRDLRPAWQDLASIKQKDDSFRFDDFFISHEPTSSTYLHSVHYVASKSLDTYIDERNDTNNTMKLFTSGTPKTTLELTYMAAAEYVHEMLLGTRAGAGGSMSDIDYSCDYDAKGAQREKTQRLEEIKRTIAWAAYEHEPDDFKRFAADIEAALNVLDPVIKKEVLQTSATDTLSALVSRISDLPASTEPHANYRLFIAAKNHIDIAAQGSQLNTICAHNGWQLITFGETRLSSNNNKYFVNLTPGKTPETCRITTNVLPEGVEKNYQDAIVCIAQTLCANRMDIRNENLSSPSRSYYSPRLPGSTPMAPQSPTRSTTPYARRATPQPASSVEKSNAQVIFEMLELGTSAAWSSSLQATETESYATENIIGLEVNNLTLRANIIFAQTRLKTAKKYIIFTQNSSREINSFISALSADHKENVFIVSNYAKVKMLDDVITIKCASGKSLISLRQLHALLLPKD